MNRLFVAVFATPLALASFTAAQPAGPNQGRTQSGAAWSWPWVRPQRAVFTTVIVPNPGTIMQRDHARANRHARTSWQDEKIAFERQHKAKLERYVATRLALAEERARVHWVRAEQLATSRFAQESSVSGRSSVTAANAAALANSVASAWVPTVGRNTPPATSSSTVGQKMGDAARHIVDRIPERTKDAFKGDDELVTSGMAHGLPKGVAIFLALLMLHVPSVAIASLVTGVFLIRGQRPRAGSLFLGLAAILSVVIFSLLPW